MVSPNKRSGVNVYFARNFITDAEIGIKKGVTHFHYRAWKHRGKSKLPGGMELDPPDDMKQLCQKNIEDYLAIVREICRTRVKGLLLEYATKIGIKRTDGQQVSTWPELKRAMNILHETNKNAINFELMYGKRFLPGWEVELENKVLVELKMAYRDWDDTEVPEPKGWIAKTNTKVLNERRKEVPYIKRRQAAEIDENGKKKRARNKHQTIFDEKKHLVTNVTSPPAKKRGRKIVVILFCFENQL